MGGTEGAAGEAAGALGEVGGAALDAATDVQTLIDALDALNGGQLSLLDATAAYEEAIDSVTAAIEENGQTTDLTTEAGRANVEVLKEIARTGAEVAAATLEQTGSQEQFYASLGVSRQALADTAVAMGMSAEQAWAFVDSVLAIPPAPAVTPTVDTTEADGQLESLILNIDSASGTITVNGNPVPAETTLGQLVGNVDAATGTVTIGGDRYPADTTLSAFLALTNTSSGTVTVNAATAAAEAAINWTARDRVSTITVRTFSDSSGPAGSTGNLYAGYAKGNQGGLVAEGRIIRGYAGGGPVSLGETAGRGPLTGLAGGGYVPGTPPADPMADNVLARGPGGLFALRSGEFVSTEDSTRRNRAALVAGNRGAALEVVRAGYAAGGGIGYARPATGAGVGMAAEDVRAAVRAGVAEAFAGDGVREAVRSGVAAAFANGVDARFGNARALASYVDAELTLAQSRQAGGR